MTSIRISHRSNIGITGLVALVVLVGCVMQPKVGVPPKDHGAATQETHASAVETFQPLAADAGAEAVIAQANPAKMLADRIEITNYAFTPGDKPSIGLTVKNIQRAEPLTFELAIEFLDAASKVVAQMPWTRTTLQPGKRHTTYAETVILKAVDARVLIRIVENPPPASASPTPK